MRSAVCAWAQTLKAPTRVAILVAIHLECNERHGCWNIFHDPCIIRLRLSDYGEYSPLLRLGEYSQMITSLSANEC